MFGSKRLKGLGDGRLKLLKGAGSGLAQMGLEFGKGLFDGIEIWTVGRQVVDLRAPTRDQLTHARHFVSGEVVEDDEIALAQFGTEHLLEVSGEDFAIEGSFDEKRCRDGVEPQRRQKGGALPVAVRNRG